MVILVYGKKCSAASHAISWSHEFTRVYVSLNWLIKDIQVAASNGSSQGLGNEMKAFSDYLVYCSATLPKFNLPRVIAGLTWTHQ